MIPLFAGFDNREAVGYHAFCASVIAHASQPVQFIPLHLDMLPFYKGGQKDGTNAFIYSRFLIPYIMGYSGWAIFADGADMVCRADISELWNLRDPFKAVQVVKHNYKTKHPRKYLGTRMEADNADYPCKNWSSLMLINCGHFGWRDIKPDLVTKKSGSELHRFMFLEEGRIGDLPIEWNWLPDELGPNEKAKILHFTTGVPGFREYRDSPMADEWFKYHALANHATD